MKKIFFCLMVISIFFTFISCQKQENVKVILIGIDGLSIDGIQCAKTPNINRLIKDGALSLKARGVMPTVSAPNWGSMLCGAGPEQHGITKNGWTKDNYTVEATVKDQDGYFPSIFNLIKTIHPNAKTALFYDWDALIDLYNKNYIDKIVFAKNYKEVYKSAINYLVEELPEFTFIYVGHVDEIGHEYQHGSDEYYKSIEEVDEQIGILLQAMEKSSLYEETNIILISDHGGVGYGHGGESMAEIQVPWLIEGPGIIKNRIIEEPINTLNTASTIAYLFGIQQPNYWIGKNVESAFTENEKSRFNQNIYLPKPKSTIKSGIYTDSQELSLSNDINSEIRYTLDGTTPDKNSQLYQSPLELDKTIIVKAISISGKSTSQTTTIDFKKVLAVKSVALLTKPSPKYPDESGGLSLVDGILAKDDFKDGEWMGFEGDDFEVILDFGVTKLINSVSLRCLENQSAWIFLPNRIEVSFSSGGRQFTNAVMINKDEINSQAKRGAVLIRQKVKDVKTRYLKIKAGNIKVCPVGHPGHGGKAWLFVDEIIVD